MCYKILVPLPCVYCRNFDVFYYLKTVNSLCKFRGIRSIPMGSNALQIFYADAFDLFHKIVYSVFTMSLILLFDSICLI